MSEDASLDVKLHKRQGEAFDSIATEILYGGAAGGGKSHLMRVAAVIWCAEIPGLMVYIFRRLSDDLEKNHLYGPGGFFEMLSPWLKTGWAKYNGSKHYIEFWNGSRILLAHCQHEKDKFKYQGAEIHLLCCEENERIRMADGSHCRVADIREGDMVATLQGPRKVTWRGERQLKPCVEAIVSAGGYIAKQIHSTTHKVLTPSEWVSYDDIACGSHPSSISVPIECRASRKCGEQSASGRHTLSQSHETPYLDSQRRGEFSGSPRSRQSASAISSCMAPLSGESDSESSLCDSQDRRLSSSSFAFPVAIHAPDLRSGGAVSLHASPHDELPCVQSGCTHEDSQCDCRLFDRLYGVYQHHRLGSGHGGAHTQDDAARRNPKSSPWGGLGKAHECSPYRSLRYDHPYTGEERISVEPVRLGTCEVSPCGERWTIDLTIEGENHYITESGLVNQNCIDELTHFSESIYRYLRGRLRLGSLNIPDQYKGVFPKAILGTNPGGVGHNWVKHAFVDAAKPMEMHKTAKPEGGMLRQYIPARLDDNPTLLNNDPDYIDRLEGLGNPALVKAMKDGDWNIVSGGAFDDVWNANRHVTPRFKVPSTWYVDRGFDWGSSHPFSVLWFAESDGSEVELEDGSVFCPPKGSIVVCHEWYGAKGPNEGLKLSAPEIAKGIKERESSLITGEWLPANIKPGPADNQISNVNESGSDSVAKKMEAEGVRWTESDKKPGSRVNGLEMIRTRLKEAAKDQPESPGLYFMEHCIKIIAHLPVLPRDQRNPDDIDTTAEDHDYDTLRYRVMNKRAKTGSTIVPGFR